MKKFLFRCLFYLQFHRLIRFLSRKKIIILMYHGFTPLGRKPSMKSGVKKSVVVDGLKPPTGDTFLTGFIDKEVRGGIANYLGYHIGAEVFRAQVEYLKKHYHVISLEHLVAYYTRGAAIPDRAVVITIDDGYKSNYTFAYPVLKEFNVPTTIFLTTDFVDKKNFLWVDRVEYVVDSTEVNKLAMEVDGEKLFFGLSNDQEKLACVQKIKSKLRSVSRSATEAVVADLERRLEKKLADSREAPQMYLPLDWSEAKEMAESGLVAIGSHTRTHAILTKGSDQEMKEELAASKRMIEDKIGQECLFFCYPNGQRGDFDDRTGEWLRESGYVCGLTAVAGMNDKNFNPFELKRFYTSSSEDLVEFIMILSGVSKFFNGLRKIVKLF